MATISVKVNKKASSAGTKKTFSTGTRAYSGSILVRPSIRASYQLHMSLPTAFQAITGPLPGGRRLAYPLPVIVEYDEDEVVVSEPRFHMHASASTEAEARAAFRRIFSGYLDVLTSHENKLDPYLREQLAYLREYIIAE